MSAAGRADRPSRVAASAVTTDAYHPDTMRGRFTELTSALLDSDPRLAVVLADIGVDGFRAAMRRHPDRVVNVGIREQLLVSAAAGLALAGLRPVAHSYAPFLVERALEQVKLDLGHQDLGAVLVSVGASYDWTEGGRTHQGPGDVALLDTLPGWTVHVPGHADELDALLRRAVAGAGRVYLRLSTRSNSMGRPVTGRLLPIRRGSPAAAVVLAVGPTLDDVLAGTAGLDVTVAYTPTVRPLDVTGLRALTGPDADVVLVEPYLAGTSTHLVSAALADRAHRVLALGVRREELHRYGTPTDHDVLHGLDPSGIRAAIRGWAGAVRSRPAGTGARRG